jgi:hypothetical protein
VLQWSLDFTRKVLPDSCLKTVILFVISHSTWLVALKHQTVIEKLDFIKARFGKQLLQDPQKALHLG